MSNMQNYIEIIKDFLYKVNKKENEYTVYLDENTFTQYLQCLMQQNNLPSYGYFGLNREGNIQYKNFIDSECAFLSS